MSIKFTVPKMRVVQYMDTTQLFAAESFINDFPELIGHVFVCPDSEFNGVNFDKYCQDRIESYLGRITPSECLEIPHQVTYKP